MAPIQAIQKVLYQEYREALADYENLSAEERKETPRPTLRQLITTDATIEALKEVLDTNPNGLIFARDELSGWARAFGQYKSGKGDDRQNWLSFWSGSQIVCNRKGQPPVFIDDPFVCLVGLLPPDVLNELIDPQGREDGMEARILFSCPDSIENAEWTEKTVEGELIYAETCHKLFNLQGREMVEFSHGAKTLWVQWINEHRKETLPDNLRSAWAKLEGYCARLALVLFETHKAASGTKPTDLDEASIQGAIDLIEYFKSHATRVYSRITLQHDTSRIGTARTWIKKRGGTVSARDIQRYRVGGVRTSEEAIELLNDLAEENLGVVSENPRNQVIFKMA
jgi:hypothetical protein